MGRSKLAILVFLLAAVACRDNPSPTGPGTSGGPQASVSGAQVAIRHPGEAAFEEISQTVPSFGGFFLEGPDVVAYVTDIREARAAEAAVRRALADHVPREADPRLANPVVTLRPAQYSFRQLAEWRDEVEGELLSIPDAAWIDLSEARNQVAIGLESGSGKTEVEQRVARLGVPPQAVTVEVTGRDVPNETLLGRVRPVEGGLATAVTFNGVAQHVPWCTYGFNAQYNGVDVVLTASHCTSATYQNDPTPTVFYQDSVRASDQVGSEWYDPNPQFYCSLPNDPFTFVGCRYSDAAMIRYDPGVSFALGFIARTVSRSVNFGFDGAILIDSLNPQFRITASQAYPVSNQQVDKVGWASGWTSGTVTGTCVDSFGTDGLWRLCTYRANYQSRRGDSGSPVFSWSGSGNNVTLVGIHWGNSTQAGYSDFSPMGGVYQDFGAVTAEKPLLSVWISGPPLIETPGTYTWEAFPTGGLASYSYKWWAHYFVSGEVDSLGTDKTQDLYVTPPICGNFEMGVRVTSGAETASGTRYVNTYTSGCGGGGELRRKPGSPTEPVPSGRARTRMRTARSIR